VKTNELLLLIRVLSELVALLDHAVRRGEPVTKKALADAFLAADAAERKWQEALKDEQ